MPSLVIAAGRMTLAALLISPFAMVKEREQIKTLSGIKWFYLCLAGLFLGFHFAAWITSLEYTSVASSVVLVTTAPLWVALLSPFLLKEKLTSWVIAGLVVSLTGSIVVGLSSTCQFSMGQISCPVAGDLFSGSNFKGNLLALTGAFLSAGYLMVGRKVRDELHLTTYIFIVYSIAAVTLLLLVLASGQKLTGYSSIHYIWLIALALIPQLIGHSAFNWALKYLSAAYVSIALLGEPVGTVILAYFFLREHPTWLEIIGGVFILAGIALATRKRKQQVLEVIDQDLL